jgi:TPR repeat protein
MYAQGDGVEVDQIQSTAWWRYAAASGDAQAQRELGERCIAGIGMDKDSDEARVWFHLAAPGLRAAMRAESDTNASESLGDMYYLGEGVARDYDQAKQCYEFGGGPHTASGERNLGKIYLNGLKVNVDRAKGIHLLQEAARQGDAEAKKVLKDQGESW